MKHLLKILFSLAIISFMSSCLESEDPYAQYTQWKADNEKAYSDSVAQNPNYVITLPSNQGGVSFVGKPLRINSVDKKPYYTDSVVVHYKGWMINGFVFDHTYTNSSDDTWDEYSKNRSRGFRVNSVVRGWSEALMRMNEGEKWRVIVPQGLGYGTSSQNSIPPFSTLIFEIDLIKVIRK